MFETAEILFVCTDRTGLARMAEGALRERLFRAGMSDRCKLVSRVLPAAVLPRASLPDYGQTELGRGFQVSGMPLTQDQVGQADLILVMSETERRALSEHFVGAEGKTCLLGEMDGARREVSGTGTVSQAEFVRLCREVNGLVDVGFETIVQRANAARTATMQRVGLSSIIYYFEFVPPSLDETLAWFSHAGIQYVDWCHDLCDDRVYTARELDRLAELFEANDLRCEFIHGFENSQVHAITDGQTLDRYVAVQSSRVELCARLGGDAVVMHIPGGLWQHLGISWSEALEHSTIALDRLRPLCEKLGVSLSVENSGEYAPFDRQKFDFYFSRYPQEFMAFCLDVGHSHLGGNLEELKGYAQRLNALHLHDNSGESDDHQPPFYGTIDWEGLLSWLYEIRYPRSLSFEMNYSRTKFGGGPDEFVGYTARRIREALSMVPGLTRWPV